MMETISIVFIVVIWCLLYYWSVRTFGHWKKLRITYVKPWPLFGNLYRFASKSENYTDTLNRIYDRLNGHRYGGYFEMREPILMIRHPNLIASITVKDFVHFQDRDVSMIYTPNSKRLNPLSVNLFALKAPRWNGLRQKLSPSFTANKLKDMFGPVKTCTTIFTRLLSEKCRQSDDDDDDRDTIALEIKDLTMNYVIDVVGVCATGVNCSSMAEAEHSVFVRMAKKTFVEADYTLKFLLTTVHPQLPKLLRVPDIPKQVTDFFVTVIGDIVRHREEAFNGDSESRKDFLQVLIDIKNGKIKDVRNEQQSLVQQQLDNFDIIDVCANAFAFFGGGFETTASTIAYCLYELCFDIDSQRIVRDEIDKVKTTLNGQELTSESLHELTYLDAIISETLRKYPPVPALFRTCTKNYTLPGTDIVIEEGTKIVVPIQALHMDPEFFPDPQKFDPSRFSNENKSKIPTGSYLPFGEGPRYCIGLRFAKLVLKYALAEILWNFAVFPCDKTESTIEFLKGVPLLCPKNGIWLTMKKIR